MTYRIAKGECTLAGENRIASFVIEWFDEKDERDLSDARLTTPFLSVSGALLTQDEWRELARIVNSEWKAITARCACGEPSYRHAEASPHASCVAGSECRSFTPATPAAADGGQACLRR